MFPTLSDLFEYVFGFGIPLPIQTFGLFVALAFVLSYFVFKSEFKRKEKEGYIKPFMGKGVLTHPYQLMDTLIFWCAICGFVGARLFSFFENITLFIADPMPQLLSANGWTFLGGLVFGALIYLYIGHKYGMKLIVLADIGSPGMLVAYAVGRMGCQLSGDGDWGIVNARPKPGWLSALPDWMWSFNFPHNVLNSGVLIPNCRGNHCRVLVEGVYPTSFYEIVIISTAFLILWLLRKKIKRSGVVFCLFLLINGLERFFIEQIRVNHFYQILGFNLTQAQLISLLMFVGGVLGLIAIYRKPSNMSKFS